MLPKDNLTLEVLRINIVAPKSDTPLKYNPQQCGRPFIFERRFVPAGNTGTTVAATGATPRTATTGGSDLCQAHSQAP